MTTSTFIFLLITGFVIPVLALSGKRKLDTGIVIPRMPLYVETIVLQTLLLALAVNVARVNKLILATEVRFSPRDLGWGAAVLVFALGSVLLSVRFANDEWRDRLFAILPSNANERVIWLGVCAAAAICEETAYRGVMFRLLSAGFGSWWIAAVATATFFALAHIVQGWKSTFVVGVFGFVFQYLVLLTGSLYLAMLVHFLYDLIVGWYLSYRIPAEPHPDDHAAL